MRLPGVNTAAAVVLCIVASSCGCDRLDMYDQPRHEAMEASNFFPDGLSARPRVPGTIARGQLHADEALFTGRVGGQSVSQLPDGALRAIHARFPQRFKQPFDKTDLVELRQALLERGHERFDIYCSVCHGGAGAGDGMIVRRGFRKPPSFHIDRLRNAPAGHYFDIVTSGVGAMPSYASRIGAADRWAIVAYVRALQLSQNARLDDVPADARSILDAASAPAGAKP
ncbi:MAG: cytochrome c [Planctomycetes bacterium]|nr:cytochrome c [Planctomycetota bacterium]